MNLPEVSVAGRVSPEFIQIEPIQALGTTKRRQARGGWGWMGRPMGHRESKDLDSHAKLWARP